MDSFLASLSKPTAFFCDVHPIFPTKFRQRPATRLTDYTGDSLARSRVKLQVFSIFRKPPRRRNSLREKLISEKEPAHLIPELSTSNCNLSGLGLGENGSNGHGLGLNLDDAKELEEAFDSNKVNFSGNSVLWDKLENWVGQYKEESECWGIGTGPIFTIFQASDGKISRVSVNEDEIRRRNRIQALSLEDKIESGEKLKDVNSKISRARVIAKDIELGAYNIPRNSSIAKFVVDENKSSVVGLIQAFSLKRQSLIRIFPGIGLMALCCFFVSCMVRKLFVGPNDTKITREEAEMLRRKKKSRMEKEKLQRGSVEVLQNGDQFPLKPATMPELHRDELMKSIVQAKKSTYNLALPSASKNLDSDKKVNEIREMVRSVHEAERQNQSFNSHTAKRDDSAFRIADTQSKHGGSAEGSAGRDNVANINSLTGQDGNVVQRDTDTLSLSNHSDQFAAKNHDFGYKITEIQEIGRVSERQNQIFSTSTTKQGDLGSIIPDTQFKPGGSVKESVCRDNVAKMDSFTGKETNTMKHVDAKDMNMASSRASDTVSLSNIKEFNRIKGDDNGVRGEQTSKPISVTSNNKSCKPRIITSLKEANEYLSAKGLLPKGAVKPERRAPEYANRSDGNLRRIKVTAPELSSFKMFEEDDKVKKLSVISEDPTEKNVAFQNMESNTRTKQAADLDYSTSETRNHNETSDHYTNMNCAEQIAKPKDIQPDNGMMGSHREELDISHDKSLFHFAEVGKPEDGITVSDSMISETKANKDWPILEEGNVLESSESDLNPAIKQSSVSTNSSSSSFDEYRDNDNFSEPDTVSSLFNSNSETAFEDLSSNSSNYGKNWVEENFQQFDSVIEKIGTGFRDNYTLAKVKAEENPLSSAEVDKLGMWGEDEELEWMKDENLVEIVFQVRKNELAGRDPFYLMDADDQRVFFEGLERKVEKANEKLAGVHEWIHSKIENLNYGADGISIDDQLDKIIPRWKGPPIDEDTDFLKKFMNNGNSVLAQNLRNLDTISGGNNECYQKSEKMSTLDNARITSSKKSASSTPKTVIECSDGSTRPGTKNSKEHWQHTKKWSQGFLEVYNAEADPEVKSVLKDMGKDLDRWITDKEIKEVGDLMTRMPKKKRRYIEKSMNRVKREVEKYGVQAVVSKYKEYAGEKEEDYLWWLDLQFVLCIEIYSVEDDLPRIGFYSLEMAEDLELEPKQYHVIAFEDAGDSKNFCYILQAHMDMLGYGKAFVVARPPKDAFREAKANGFSVTLIRKGQVKVNVDQTLEEVEEELKVLGSKIYHDKIMNERGVDIRSLTRGMVAASKFNKR